MSEYRIYSFSYTRNKFSGYEAVKATSAGYALDYLIQHYPDNTNWEYVSDVPVLAESVSTVLGDSRPVLRYYGTGEFDCPYCGTATNKPQCFNPWCDANPHYSPAKLIAEREKREAIEREKSKEESIRQFRINSAKEYDDRRNAARQETINKAKESGHCVTCATRYPPKLVKHRKECPHSR